ncbi:hypothetical protein H6F89_06695 [Cyanobacteria bacterium FACHB-63]|nr:hypothetical protein [Cyanobacteria bacterium FACHB-63]
MFKLISCMVAGAVALAPMLPAQAGYGVRSSGFGVSIGTSSRFGAPSRYPGEIFYRNSPGYNGRVIIRTPNNGYYNSPGYNGQVIIRTPNNGYYNSPGYYNNGYYNNGYYAPGYYSPGFFPPVVPGSTVIVTPRARKVIVNPGFGFGNYTLPACGSAIYGSPIASPIPVNPYTGLACR